ncbi:MAG: hypothetical protein JSV84_11465 [Gemmatimonadota bacterium]|nr:MAG: hypothetical protein JSV84_11465 [Gemmatimonadota bacterium]
MFFYILISKVLASNLSNEVSVSKSVTNSMDKVIGNATGENEGFESGPAVLREERPS